MESAILRNFVLGPVFAAILLFQGATFARGTEHQMAAGLKGGTIAVMPFFTGEYSSQIETGRPPLQFLYEQIAAEEGDKKVSGEKALTKLMNEALMQRMAQQVIAPELVQNEFMRLTIDNLKDTPLTIAVRLGKNLQAEYVVVGIVWEYRDRVGTKLAAEEPATVSFSAFLVDVAAGQRIWREKYTRTQQSLSDNLLKAPEFFKQGGKWLSANDLARYGIKKMLGSFPL